MFFKNPQMFPYNCFGIGPGGGTTLGDFASQQAMQNQHIMAALQRTALQASLQDQRNRLKAQLIFGPPPGVTREDVVAQIKELETATEGLTPQTPFSGERETATIALEQLAAAREANLATIAAPVKLVKDVTPPEPEFECAECGVVGPKDRLKGCMACGGMVWK